MSTILASMHELFLVMKWGELLVPLQSPLVLIGTSTITELHFAVIHGMRLEPTSKRIRIWSGWDALRLPIIAYSTKFCENSIRVFFGNVYLSKLLIEECGISLYPSLSKETYHSLNMSKSVKISTYPPCFRKTSKRRQRSNFCFIQFFFSMKLLNRVTNVDFAWACGGSVMIASTRGMVSLHISLRNDCHFIL